MLFADIIQKIVFHCFNCTISFNSNEDFTLKIGIVFRTNILYIQYYLSKYIIFIFSIIESIKCKSNIILIKIT